MKSSLSKIGALALVGLLTGCSSTTPTASETPQASEAPTQTALASEAPQTTEPVVETTYQAPYNRIAGYAVDGDLPLAVWVDFDPNDDTILNIEITGYGNPVMMADFGEQLGAYNSEKESYYGTAANAVESVEEDVLSAAVKSAADRYLASKDTLIIRPYQSLMTMRYMANNPYIVDNTTLSGDTKIATEIVAQYPADAAYLVEEDVLNNDAVTYPAGTSTSTFTKESGEEYTITHQVIRGNQPGVVIVSYTYGDTTVYDALDIYDNFTMDLSGSDSYGLVVSTMDQNDSTITYRVLGDKAMNFAGGTCGSTVLDVTIDTTDDTIANVHVVEHSDSTYLANPWEYDGAFANVGKLIYDINSYTDLFTGLSATTPITKYDLTSDDVEGGVVVDGGIDMVVTGATRTPNAIISAVNAAIEAYSVQ